MDKIRKQYRKEPFIVLLGIFLLMLYFNYCTPLNFDDYVYSFVFSDSSMGVPLPETAKRVDGIGDLFVSQWHHYFSWGGRTVAHLLAQFFLWQGKTFFNIANAACFLILVIEINWIINKGKVSFSFITKDILLIFSLLWIFSFDLGDVFVWLTLSCNYLWTTVLLLALLIFYEEKYFLQERKNVFLKYKFILFLISVTAGWTNENTACFIIAILLCFLFNFQNKGTSFWDIEILVGLAGLSLGFCLLILAPGNYIRYMKNLQDGMLLTGVALVQRNLLVMIKIIAVRSLLYYYIIKKIYEYKKNKVQENKKDIIVALVFLFLSIASLMIMLISPEFRYRSSFPSLVFLIISTGIMRNIKSSNNHSLIESNSTDIIKIIGVIYLCITLLSSLYLYTLQRHQTEMMLTVIKKEQSEPQKKVLIVRERPYALRDYPLLNTITGAHLIFPYSITSDEHSWINKDVSLYYGITAIKTEKEEDLR